MLDVLKDLRLTADQKLEAIELLFSKELDQEEDGCCARAGAVSVEHHKAPNVIARLQTVADRGGNADVIITFALAS